VVDPVKSFDLVLVAAAVPSVNASGSAWDAFGGLPDPYAKVVSTRGATKHEGQTPALSDTPNPIWNAVVLAGVTAGELKSSVRIDLFDDDVALDEFVLTSHMGGFTGEQGSIRDYQSRLRFRDGGEAGAWGETVDVSVNSPVTHDGLWYFQAQWDPPDSRPREGEVASAGLNYTVLGVGNREGVYTQLLGCCIAVAGMIYAFYVKPMIKRRRQAEGPRYQGATRRRL
jgi:hypothetical protein